MNHFIRSSLLVTASTILTMGLVFLSNIIIATKFGAGKEMDLFWTVIIIPMFISGILTNSLSFTFIPVLAEYQQKSTQETWRIINNFMNFNLLITGILSIFIWIFAYPLLNVIIPGFDMQKLRESTELLRWLCPLIILMVNNELLSNIHYLQGRFLLPSIYKVLTPIITIISIILFHNYWGIKAIIVGMLIAHILQLFLLFTAIVNIYKIKYSYVLEFSHPGIRKTWTLMLPLILGMIVYRAIPFVDRYFLSLLPEGSISYIGYAFQILTALSSFVVSGLAISLFPRFSEQAAKKDLDQLRTLMSKGLSMVFFLSLPLAFIFGAYGKIFIRYFLEGGAFSPSDTIAVSNALGIYCWALPATVMGTIIAQGYYVLQDTKTPVIIGLVETVLYVVLCYILISKISFLAIPLAYSIYFNLSSVVCAFILRYKLGNRGGGHIIRSMLKNIVALLFVSIFLHALLRNSLYPLIQLSLLGISVLLYFAINRYIFKTEESRDLFKLFRFKA